jgi:hypothetical protein
MKKFYFTIVFLFSSFILFAQTATAPSGTGTSADPYQIATLNNLYWVTQNPSSWATGKYFVQTANIEAATSSTWASGAGFSPIGNPTTKFQGNYNGGGFIINGLFCNRTSSGHQALFGYVNGSSTISNLGVTNVNLTGSNMVAGLVGQLDEGTISKCYSTGMVKSTTNSTSYGGLVGLVFTPGPVLIKECFSTANVSGGGYNLGGFVGGNWAPSTNSIIQDCFSTGNVTKISGSTDSGTGAFCGLNNGGKIVRCYTTGNVYYTGATAPTSKGFIGASRTDNGTPVTNDNYWDNVMSNQTANTIGATGKTTAEMKTQATFANWDFTNVWGLSATANSGYPNLGGIGTLPLTWQHFNVTEQNNTARLFWSTTSESNTADFTIEHSTNGVLWNHLGSLAAAGNSKQVQHYSFLHINPTTGNNYYRILQSDLDGRKSYSKIVVLDFMSKIKAITAYPNPVINGNLNLIIGKAGIICVYDITGKIMIKQYLNAGNQTVNLTNFSPGVYQVKSENEQISILVK